MDRVLASYLGDCRFEPPSWEDIAKMAVIALIYNITDLMARLKRCGPRGLKFHQPRPF